MIRELFTNSLQNYKIRVKKFDLFPTRPKFNMRTRITTLTPQLYIICPRKMLDLQHQYNNCTTNSHMKVDPTHWDPPSYEGLLCSCCDGVV